MTKKNKTLELLDRRPPCDHDAEAATLGIALTHPQRFSEIAKALSPDDFSDECHRILYGAMLRLEALKKPIDVTLLVGELHDFGEYDRDNGVNATTLVNLYRLFPLVTNLPYYLARVLEMSRRRRGLNRGIQLVQAAHNVQPGPELPPAARAALQLDFGEGAEPSEFELFLNRNKVTRHIAGGIPKRNRIATRNREVEFEQDISHEEG